MTKFFPGICKNTDVKGKQAQPYYIREHDKLKGKNEMEKYQHRLSL